MGDATNVSTLLHKKLNKGETVTTFDDAMWNIIFTLDIHSYFI